MIGRNDIRAAHGRIRDHVRLTPVIALEAGAFGLDAELSLKLELLQHSGSFKPRGAFNTLLSAEVPEAGVVAASGGNHGVAVAFVAERLGLPVHIFVPEISAAVKIARIEGYGARLHVGGQDYAEALELSQRFATETGALAVHAYDQETTLAGQGTVGLEWQAQAPDIDTVLVAVGGGGLLGGIAAWYGDDVRIVAVEPETSCALAAALAAGRPVDVPVSGIAADSLGARSVGVLMYPIAEQFVDEALTVSDADIERAQHALWTALRLVAEPGGATALAALLGGAYVPRPGEKVGVLVCGGNADPGRLAG